MKQVPPPGGEPRGNKPSGGNVKSILDPSFRYTPSTSTDLRKTFARVRREMQKTQAQAASRREADAARVVPFARTQQPSVSRR
jgi:hypothetical protein